MGGSLSWSWLAITMATLLGSSNVLSQELSMMMLSQPPPHIRPPPKPHWLHLEYDLHCKGEDGVIKQPSEQSASRGLALSWPFALVLGFARSQPAQHYPSPQTVWSHDKGQSDQETERVRYIIVVVLSVMTVVCIGLTVGLIYLKRRYLKYQIHPDAPSEETNFLWNYHIRGLRWTRYRSSEQPPSAAPPSPVGLSPEFTEMVLQPIATTQVSKQGPASTVRLELRERCSTSSGISLSNSDVQEEPPDVVTSTLQPQLHTSIAELGEMMQCLAETRMEEEEEEEEEKAAIHEAPTLQLRRPLRQLRPLRDEVMPRAQTEEPNRERRRRRRRQPRRRPPQPSSPSSSSPCSTLPRSRPPPKRSSSGHRRHSRSLGYESDNEIEV